jgi:hypothetical protein
MDTDGPLLFAHLGDLHITRASNQNYLDFLSILVQLETECRRYTDFVVLPGDNADDGLPEQYELVATGLKLLSSPVYIITGDHDMASGNLDAFYSMPMTRKLPIAITVKGIRCLFLDMCGSGTGGPDFRLGTEQLAWLADQLGQAREQQKSVILFMHTYPADCADKQETYALNKLIADYRVVLVDLSHTHYNELANDGHTIFAATRSTGQIEEGTVGYSLVSIDQGTVSWRFKGLYDAFPFVLITTPADYRLWREDDQPPTGGLTIVRAVVLGNQPFRHVTCQLNQDLPVPMAMSSDGKYWEAELDIVAQPVLMLTVEAVDERGRPGRHTIELVTPFTSGSTRHKQGSDADSIGTWLQNGILGTQLGPNRNGSAW